MNTASIHIFDRALVRRHRDRAAAAFAPHHNALHQEIAAQMVDRLTDVKRDFSSVLDLGAHDGFLARQLAEREGRFVVAAEQSAAMLRHGRHVPSVVADEEILPFAPASFDLITSNLSLHWVNDLPGTLAQVRQVLRPEGMFLATLFGGDTLYELRACLLEAEMVVTGGASPRVSPSLTMQTASGLLQRAGFSLPVTDQEVITLTYSNIFALMRDLRGMGEVNAHAQRLRHPTRRAVFDLANTLYIKRFGLSDGRIPARFEILFLHGWH